MWKALQQEQEVVAEAGCGTSVAGHQGTGKEMTAVFSYPEKCCQTERETRRTMLLQESNQITFPAVGHRRWCVWECFRAQSQPH